MIRLISYYRNTVELGQRYVWIRVENGRIGKDVCIYVTLHVICTYIHYILNELQCFLLRMIAIVLNTSHKHTIVTMKNTDSFSH